MSEKITIEVVVERNIAIAWEAWTNPIHIEKWNQADESWHCPKAINDVRVGGRFIITMAAKDGSASFDFSGTYTEVEEERKIVYMMDDNRTAEVNFIPEGESITKIREIFDAENENSVELQRQGWQSILNSFKNYTEAKL